MRCPRAGGVLINSAYTHILLVKPDKSQYRYGLPRGKIESGEKLEDAARREIFEETGYDCGDLARGNHYSASYKCNHVGARLQLYFVENVPEDYYFYPECRYEIFGYWFVSLDDITDNGLFRLSCGKFIDIFSRGVKSSLPDVKAFCCQKRKELAISDALGKMRLLESQGEKRGDFYWSRRPNESRLRQSLGRDLQKKRKEKRKKEERNASGGLFQEDEGGKITYPKTPSVDLARDIAVVTDYCTIGPWTPVDSTIEEQLRWKERWYRRNLEAEKKRQRRAETAALST